MPYLSTSARLPNTDFPCRAFTQGTGIHRLRRDHYTAVTAKKFIFHPVPPRGFRKSLCFFQLHQIIQNHTLPSPKGFASLRCSQTQHYYLETRKKFQPAQTASLNRSRPRSRLNSILLDSLKLLPSPFSLTSCTVRKTMDSFSIRVKLLDSFRHL